MAKRAMFLWVVFGLMLTVSVVATHALVDTDEVVAAAADEPVSTGVGVALLAVEEPDVGYTNGLPTCKYPDTCPPPPRCKVDVEFGQWRQIGDSGRLQISFRASHNCGDGAAFSRVGSVSRPIANGYGSYEFYECRAMGPVPGPLVFQVTPVGGSVIEVSIPVPNPISSCPPAVP